MKKALLILGIVIVAVGALWISPMLAISDGVREKVSAEYEEILQEKDDKIARLERSIASNKAYIDLLSDFNSIDNDEYVEELESIIELLKKNTDIGHELEYYYEHAFVYCENHNLDFCEVFGYYSEDDVVRPGYFGFEDIPKY